MGYTEIRNQNDHNLRLTNTQTFQFIFGGLIIGLHNYNLPLSNNHSFLVFTYGEMDKLSDKLHGEKKKKKERENNNNKNQEQNQTPGKANVR